MEIGAPERFPVPRTCCPAFIVGPSSRNFLFGACPSAVRDDGGDGADVAGAVVSVVVASVVKWESRLARSRWP